MPGRLNRYRGWLALLASAAVLAVAAAAGLDGPGGVAPAVALERGSPAAAPSVVRTGHGTTDADIDAVPGLRAQLDRQAEAAGSRARRTRAGHGTTDADIDAVPGLRAQLARQAASAPVTSSDDGPDGGDAVIDTRGAVGLAAVVALGCLVASRLRRRDGYSHGIG